MSRSRPEGRSDRPAGDRARQSRRTRPAVTAGPPPAPARRAPTGPGPRVAARPEVGEARRGRRETFGRVGDEDLIYGRNAVLEAARAGRVVRGFVAEGLKPDRRLIELSALAPIETVAPERLDAMTGGLHQGVAARVRPLRMVTLKELLAPRPSLLVGLDGILDPQNLGTILRSAEAAGATGAILPSRRSARVTAAAVKAASGAVERLTLCEVAGLPSAIAEIKRAGIWCIALDAHGGRLPWELDLTLPTCLVVGGEGEGVHRLVRARCDEACRVPILGRAESLNAAAAAAAVLFEAVRQRVTSGGAGA